MTFGNMAMLDVWGGVPSQDSRRDVFFAACARFGTVVVFGHA